MTSQAEIIRKTSPIRVIAPHARIYLRANAKANDFELFFLCFFEF